MHPHACDPTRRCTEHRRRSRSERAAFYPQVLGLRPRLSPPGRLARPGAPLLRAVSAPLPFSPPPALPPWLTLLSWFVPFPRLGVSTSSVHVSSRGPLPLRFTPSVLHTRLLGSGTVLPLPSPPSVLTASCLFPPHPTFALAEFATSRSPRHLSTASPQLAHCISLAPPRIARRLLPLGCVSPFAIPLFLFSARSDSTAHALRTLAAPNR